MTSKLLAVTSLLMVGVLIAIGVAADTPTTGPTTAPAITFGNSYQIENVATGKLLRPEDANSADGTRLVVYPHEDWKCMTWKFQKAGDDIRLMNHFTGKTLTPESDGTVKQHKAAKDPIDTEKWKFVPIDGSSLYRIQNMSTGDVLTVDGDRNVSTTKSAEQDEQKWRLLPRPAHFTG